MEKAGYSMMPLEIIKRKTNIKASWETRAKEQFCTSISEYKANMFRLARSILHNDTDAEDAKIGRASCRERV